MMMKKRAAEPAPTDVVRCFRCNGECHRPISTADMQRVMPVLPVIESKDFDRWDCVYSEMIEFVCNGDEQTAVSMAMRQAILGRFGKEVEWVERYEAPVEQMFIFEEEEPLGNGQPSSASPYCMARDPEEELEDYLDAEAFSVVAGK